MAHSKRIQTCKVCQRATNHAYICRRCANELADLLIGSHEPDGQPGIAWYVGRLRESAYGQTKLARSLSARASREGYAQLGNQRAFELLGRIAGVLARWEAITERLRSTHSQDQPVWHMGLADRHSERLEKQRARFIAGHVVLLRHHCPEVHKLHAELLGLTQQAWRIINRPNDVCCGPCPTKWSPDVRTPLAPCGTMLYAAENEATVVCPQCHTLHSVEDLRERLRHAVSGMLFTRAELVSLMETRLNDRIPQPTFTKLLRDGRLQPRYISYDDTGRPVPMFTYDDVCAARAKPVPAKRVRSA